MDDLTGPAGTRDDRIAITDGAIALFRHHAFHEVTFALLATQGQMPASLVKAQFPTWDNLIMAVLDRWNGQRMRPLTPLVELGAVLFLRGLVQANISDPAFMRFLTALVNIAATPEHVMASQLQREWNVFHQLIKNALNEDIRAEREPSTMDPGRGAEQLIALYEGLQLQSMVRPNMDLLDSFDRGVTRLRNGWATPYRPPIWELDFAAPQHSNSSPAGTSGRKLHSN